ncbi:hypothetical protein AALO_G00301250 [Alosa alosa]|uniref:Gypsy retrotransposon integrase-like protein 1 n=1 Tax=Alosa alosa TaxID=278164 RepID=A0AAV6FEK1_9TELE|nr:hypothetical protein AALO_G00301250 [Alosa alosa]
MTLLAKTWRAAQIYCQANYVSLASINNMVEQAELEQLLKIHEADEKSLDWLEQGSQEAWISLRRVGWEWTDGSDPSFNYFQRNAGNTEMKNCAALDFNLNGKWEDDVCTNQYPFVCHTMAFETLKSALEVGEEPQIQAETAAIGCDVTVETSDSWKDWQEVDKVLATLKGWVTRGHLPRAEERKMESTAVRHHQREWKRLSIQDGVQERNTGLDLAQIIVPANKTWELWDRYHQASGHMGMAKVKGLRKTFYWPGMGTDLQKWTSMCPDCIQQKGGP